MRGLVIRIWALAVLVGLCAVTAKIYRQHSAAFAFSLAQTDPLSVPVVMDAKTGGCLHEKTEACSDRVIHLDPVFCREWPKACEWIKWHERGHVTQGFDGSRQGEDLADDYASRNALPEETRDAAKWFRSQHRRGFYEAGTHAHFLDRAIRMEQIAGISSQERTARADKKTKIIKQGTVTIRINAPERVTRVSLNAETPEPEKERPSPDRYEDDAPQKPHPDWKRLDERGCPDDISLPCRPKAYQYPSEPPAPYVTWCRVYADNCGERFGKCGPIGILADHQISPQACARLRAAHARPSHEPKRRTARQTRETEWGEE